MPPHPETRRLARAFHPWHLAVPPRSHRLPALDQGRFGGRAGEQRGFKVEAVEPVLGPLAWTTMFRLLGFQEVLRKIPFLGELMVLPLICLMNCRMVLEDWITPASMTAVHAAIYVTLSRK